MIIEFLKQSEIPMILDWWKESGEECPSVDMMPPTTFVIKNEDTYLACVSLFITNGPLVWVENLISNPHADKKMKAEGVELLNQYILNFSKQLGKTKMFCMGLKKSIGRRYRQLGFNKTADVSTFIKEIA